jgi:hypothetical protein
LDAEQRRFHRALLRRPGLAAVRGGEDDAEFSDHPATIGGGEVHIVEEHVAGIDDFGNVGGQREIGRQGNLRPGCSAILGAHDRAEVTDRHTDLCGGERHAQQLALHSGLQRLPRVALIAALHRHALRARDHHAAVG